MLAIGMRPAVAQPMTCGPMLRPHRPALLAAIGIALVLAAPVYGRPSAATTDEAADEDDETDGDSAEAIAMMPLALDRLIEIAVRLSPDLARARSERTGARAAAAAERRAQAWTMTSNARYARNAIAERVQAPPYSTIAQEQRSIALGLGRALPSGGQLGVELGVEHTHTQYSVLSTLRGTPVPQVTGAAATPTEYSDTTQASARATFKQPLARGFGPTIALAGERKGDLAASVATVRAQLAAEDLLRELIVRYWELAFAQFEVDVRLQALELAQNQEQLTRVQMRAGTLASSALDAVTYEIAVRDEARLRAEMTLEQRSLELRRLAGLELSRREIVLRPSASFELGDDDIDLDAVLARSKTANRRLAALTLERRLADLDVQLARDRVKPQLDLELSGALIGVGDATTGALGGLGGGEAYQVSVGVSMSWEISSAARHGADAAAAKRRRVDIDQADMARQIETEIVLAVKSVATARTRVGLAERAIAVAENNVRAERVSFLVGRTTNFAVMQRQGELIEARLRRGRAVADYHVAVAHVQYLDGALLDAHGVEARPRARRR